MAAADVFLLVLALLVFPCAGLEGKSLPHRLLISDLKIDLFYQRFLPSEIGRIWLQPLLLLTFTAARQCKSAGRVVSPAHRYRQYTE